MAKGSKNQMKDFANDLLQGMLQHNYLPNQKERRDELPRILNSETLTPSVAEKIRSLPLRNGSHRGYDWVAYRSTRFNGVTRSLSIPHPLPYCRLAHSIYTNWDRLDYILENEHSMILPRKYPDGRVLLMDYDDGSNSGLAPNIESLGKKVKVYTDIANFYPSVYSHAIPWALVGMEQAKKTMTKRNRWYNKLDAAIRQTHRGETLGLPTGPATSAILAETILAKVDQKLHGKFVFRRYMDDYVAFCKNQQEAEQFVLRLEGLLGEYGLRVNAGKTRIIPLPATTSDDWHVDLRQAFAARGRGAGGLSDCLNLALRLSSGFPDGSVLKYALSSAVGRALGEGTTKEVDMVLRYGLEWGIHNAAVVPVLCTLWNQAKELALEDAAEANWRALLQAHIVTGHYDAVAWLLELGFKHKYRIPASYAKAILQSQDCIALLLLYIAGSPKQKREVVGFCKNLNAKDVYLLDQYWLLLYQLFTWGRIGNPYSSDKTFEVMKAEGVNFVGNTV